MPKKGDAREFNVLAAGADRSFAKFFLGKFPGGIPDLKRSIDGGPWRMRRGQPPEPNQEPTPTPKPLETTKDWILESAAKPGMPVLKGKPEGAGGGSSYFLLVKARGGDDFIAMPIDQTYNFKPVRRGGAVDLEDAEAEMKYRREQYSKISTKLAAIGGGEGGDDGIATAGKATENSTGQPIDEDGDSDEEFKDIKARAAVTAALKQRAANQRARRQQQQQAPNIALDDAVAGKHEATWNEVFQEPPKDAEDWEHENEAADDDLDMGGGEEEEGDNDDDLGLGGDKGGGGGMGGGMGSGGGGKGRGDRLGSPSDSDDDDGAAAAARVHRRLKRMMKESGLTSRGGGDGMSSEDDDLYSDGEEEEDSDSDMIEDVDDLDRMAEDMMSGGGGGEKKSGVGKEEEEEGGLGGKKRKAPTPPVPAAVGVPDKQEDAQTKKLKVDNTQQQQQEVTIGPVTADEIIIMLRGRGKMSLSDIAAYFKARLKTPQDKKDFTALVKKVAKLDPQPDPDGKKYLILK